MGGRLMSETPKPAVTMDASELAKYDLTHAHAKFLDLHLILPLMEFAQQNGLYNEEDIMKAKLELLGKTNMIDFMGDEHKKLYGDFPKDMGEKKEKIISQLGSLNEAVEPILGALDDISNKQPTLDISLETLSSYKITEAQVESLYSCAQFLFSIANYENSGYLLHYRALSTNEKRSTQALWGHFAAEILTQNWDRALDTCIASKT